MRFASRAGVLLASMAVAAGSACTTDYQKGLDDPTYAGPNVFEKETPPGSTNEIQGEQKAGSDSTDPLCKTNGGTVVAQTTPCAVTWTSIHAEFVKASCSAVAGCHGTGVPEPLISQDKNTTYNAITKFSISKGKLYVNPCSTDLAQSAIAQNINPAAPEGDRGTLMPPGVGLAALVANLETWVKCGAPNN